MMLFAAAAVKLFIARLANAWRWLYRKQWPDDVFRLQVMERMADFAIALPNRVVHESMCACIRAAGHRSYVESLLDPIVPTSNRSCI